MLARVVTFAIDGLEPRRVTVEIDVRAGLPSFTIVGLADRAVREARERVRAAILNSGLRLPAAPRHRQPRARVAAQGRARASTSRSPARSSPPRGQVPAEALERFAVFGELALDGEVRAVPRRARRGRGRRGGPGSRGSWCRATACRGRARRRPRRRGRRRPSRRWPASCAAKGAAPPRRARGAPRAARRHLDLADVRGHADVVGALDHRRGRRPQPAALRPAGHRQDDARPAAAVDPAAARRAPRRSR